MRMPDRLLRAALLLPATLLLGLPAGIAAAQENHAHADESMAAPPATVRTMRWSDPAAWPDGKVPGEGDAVTIGRDMDVVLDVDPPALRSLTIEGKLSFSDDLRYRARDRVDLPARGRAGDRQRGQSLHAQCDHHPDRQRSRRRHQHHGRPRDHADGRHAEPAWRPRERLDQAREDCRSRQHPDRSSRCRWLAAQATRSSSPRPTSIPGRRRGAPSPPSAATCSRSISRWNTCTSARSPSASTSAAKSAC